MSRYYFHRLFSAVTGSPLNGYLLSRIDVQENPIELIRIFSPGDRDMTDYEICVPIKKLEGE
ncbi:MAG: hypothetical protein JXA95_11130 [Spirochaetales bacterium]|nr:hypothetical protein [Spirochaetales bacterium]